MAEVVEGGTKPPRAEGGPSCPHRALRQAIRLRLLHTRLLGFTVLLLVLVSASHWTVRGPQWVGIWLFAAGAVLAVAGFVGRTWALRHIGGRKKVQLVRTGPYSWCRHPLYLFSLVGGMGLVLCTQRLTLVALYIVISAVVMPVAIRHEDSFLEHNFDEYAAYRATTPALLPRFRWVPSETVAPIDARALGRGILDSIAFLSPLLLLPLFAELQETGVIPFLLVLP